ncbi:FAD-binding oxidoreductase [Mesorhizobium sp. RP14(2022)]|uniref:FAD-binding oxidoreductase n=1 Tax=Mesorhizobium liriopis TaxID=2953882 RepID=A0ABT1C6N8_9HYPH|nr:FAD-binding oxidoreductase [Mesorhizobium liriopis]MCO6050492.1 FAD-binding oxidoreductase [Mesorhizobium liriopis]
MDETAHTSVYVLDRPPAVTYPALTEAAVSDIAIVGGGLTGLSAALHAVEAGKSVTVLEAYEPGWGASGRNGGQLNPGLKYDPSWFLQKLGQQRGQALVDFAWSSVDKLAEIIARADIACDMRRNGTIRAAVKSSDIAAVQASQQDMQEHGMPVDWLDRPALAKLVGHDHYQGGFLDRRGGDLDPLRLTLGLASAASSAGAAIHGSSRVVSLRRDGSAWRLTTDAGATVMAQRVLVCCNGYADGLIPSLRQSLVPVFSSILASNPLPGNLADRIMPGRQSLYESGLVVVYCRVDDKNRLIIGGRGPMRPVTSPSALRHISLHAQKLWPELNKIGWQTAWNGRVAVTNDYLPHFHELGDGLYALYGYNGRGVALAVALGQPLAGLLAGESKPNDIPIPPTSMKRIPMHSFWPLGVKGTIAMSRLKERFRG